MMYIFLTIFAAILAMICVIWFINERMKKPTDRHISETFSAVASRLLEIKESDDTFKFISDEIHRVCGNSIVLVQSYDRMYDQFYSKGISGFHSFLQKGVELWAADYMNTSFKPDEGSKMQILRGRFEELGGGVYRIASGKIPKRASKMVERFFKIKKIYGMGFVKNEVLFGNVLIIPIFGNNIPDANQLEAGINLISDALYKRRGNK